MSFSLDRRIGGKRWGHVQIRDAVPIDTNKLDFEIPQLCIIWELSMGNRELRDTRNSYMQIHA